MRRGACTIVSANYLPYARTLCGSFKEQHPDYELYVLLVDRAPKEMKVVDQLFTLVCVEDLNLPYFNSIAFQFDILELNTNVKPSFLRWLFAKGLEQIIYFDPDIRIFSSVNFIYELLESYNVILTPHSVTPPIDPDHKLEQELLSLGVYNLGFVAVANSEESNRFLEWWESRCLQLGFADPRNGLFVDQKWANLIPSFFSGVHILKHLGCNMAHWNIHERHLSPGGDSFLVEGTVPLVFYHFSGVKAEDAGLISRKGSTVVTVDGRRDLADILAGYRARLVANDIAEYQNYKYAFGEFSDGIPISILARRVYSFKKDDFPSENPFRTESRFYQFAKEHNLLRGKDRSGRFNALNYNPRDLRIRAINKMLKLLLAMLGSDRYTMLMKYLSFISLLRNQKELF